MRFERAYNRRTRAVTFAGATRTVTLSLEVADFERLEKLATQANIGNATLAREIILSYLKVKKNPAVSGGGKPTAG
jgi:predicted DNA-binding ribbon-helix-helix protein